MNASVACWSDLELMMTLKNGIEIPDELKAFYEEFLEYGNDIFIKILPMQKTSIHTEPKTRTRANGVTNKRTGKGTIRGRDTNKRIQRIEIFTEVTDNMSDILDNAETLNALDKNNLKYASVSEISVRYKDGDKSFIKINRVKCGSPAN